MNDELDSVSSFFLLLALLAALWAFTGCGASGERAQAQADAHEGVVAITGPGEETIARGVHANIEAATGTRTKDLPPPASPASEIREDGGVQYAAAAEERRDRLGGGWWGLIGAGALAALGIGARFAGLHGPVMGLISAFVEPKHVRRAREHERSLAGVATNAIGLLEGLPPQIAKPVKKQISKVVSPDEEAALRRVLAEIEDRDRLTPAAKEG